MYLFLCGVAHSVQGQYTAEKLRAGDLQEQSRFGTSVSASDRVIAIGAPHEVNNSSPGAAYVFERKNGIWTKTQKLLASDFQPDDWFGATICCSSNIIAVSSCRKNYDAAIYVFQCISNLWVETGKLTAPDADGWDQFGAAIDISGTTIAVGCPRSWWTEPPGSVYIYDLVGRVWTQTAKLAASDASTFDQFGQSVSIDGDQLLVGGCGESGGYFDDPYSGAVYYFIREYGQWSEAEKLVPDGLRVGSNFGDTVAINATTIAVGAPGDNTVYVWGPSGGDTKLTGYGTSVDLCGNLLAIGDAANLFEFTNQVWTFKGSLCAKATGIPPSFSGAVSISKEITVVGKDFYNDPALYSGAAYVIERDRDGDGAGDPTELAVGSNPDNPDTDGDGSNDGHELDSGTNPLDSNDVFKVTSQGSTNDLFWIKWNVKNGKTYQIQNSSDLTHWFPAPSNSIQEIFQSLRYAPTNGSLLYVDPSPKQEKSFYRIILQQP